MKQFFNITLATFTVYLLLWILVYFTGINKLLIQSEDTISALFLPVTIIKSQTLYADQYYEQIRSAYPHPDDKSNILGLTPFYFKNVNSHYITAFPLISGLLALPIFIIPIMAGLPINLISLGVLGRVSAMIITSISCGLFYLLVKKHFLEEKSKAILLTIIYAFGTINFALVSQSLWQHGTLELFLILALYFLFERKFFLSGLFGGIAILSRPTGVIPFMLLFVIVFADLWPDLKKIFMSGLKYCLGLFPSVVFFLWYNATYYLSFSNQGYASQATSQWLSKFPDGFLGIWLSPSKGILVYSPVFLFICFSLYVVFKKITKDHIKYIVFFLVILIHTLIMGKWKHWYGGWSFGYRMSADVIPYLVLALVPYLKFEFFDKTKKLFYALVVISIAVQLYGMAFFDGIWHSAYDKGFQNTSWLWSISDSELVFNLRRILVKLHMLERACPQCLPD